METFSVFINDRYLNHQQLEFILKIINHIENIKKNVVQVVA